MDITLKVASLKKEVKTKTYTDYPDWPMWRETLKRMISHLGPISAFPDEKDLNSISLSFTMSPGWHQQFAMWVPKNYAGIILTILDKTVGDYIPFEEVKTFLGVGIYIDPKTLEDLNHLLISHREKMIRLGAPDPFELLNFRLGIKFR